jgi:hypothetical protein
MRVIQARAHGWKAPGAFEGIGVAKAKEMASEGVKRKASGLARELRKR